MKISKQISVISHSLGIIIDKPILDELNLKKGDWIEVDIKKLSHSLKNRHIIKNKIKRRK
jgi:antitoxin component of MazEF toxin-antitoxin module